LYFRPADEDLFGCAGAARQEQERQQPIHSKKHSHSFLHS
jgi:hypothetical protein